jgi:hypothetical protein
MCTGVEIRNLATAPGTANRDVFRKIKDFPFQLPNAIFKQCVLVPELGKSGYKSLNFRHNRIIVNVCHNRSIVYTRLRGTATTIQFLDNGLESPIAGPYLIYISEREFLRPVTKDRNIDILGNLIEHCDGR